MVRLCRNHQFLGIMDEYDDSGNEKCVATLVRVLDRSVSNISMRFLAIPVGNIGTAENLFSSLELVFL